MWLVHRSNPLADQLIDVERVVRLLPRVFRSSLRLALLPLALLLTTAALLPASVPTAEAAGECAAFVADVNWPDNSHVTTNQGIEKVWRLRNCGPAWSGVKAVRVGGSFGPSELGVPNVGAGQTFDLRTTIQAPGGTGTARATYQLQRGNVRFGQTFWVQLVVEAPKPSSPAPKPPTPAPGPTPAPTVSKPSVDQGRIDMIKRLYRELLGREADQGGLDAYYKGGLNESQIRQSIMGSEEYRRRQQSTQPTSGRQTGNGNVFRQAGYGDQCTAYALDRMHDATGLWMKVTGNAGQWADQARTAGWTVGTAPSARAVMVMPNASGYRYTVRDDGKSASYTTAVNVVGHVAWVEQINGDWALVSDQNWRRPGEVGKRWVYVKGAPLQFIYADR